MPTLEFKGKSFVYTHHLSVPFRELVIDAKKSLPARGQKPSLEDNLIIHGDSIHALKALLPVYAGKVDCVFIDPPYNTGNEGWCYKDDVRSPLMREWVKKAAPVDKEDLERHDKWLCMFYPRVRLLYELLSETGALWMTLDDNEVHRARGVLDEVFGEECCVGQLAWQKRTSRENRTTLSPSFDHILLYSKCLPDTWKLFRNLLDAEGETTSNPDNDSRGPWKSIPFSAQGYRKAQDYKIVTPTGKVLEPPKGRCWGATEPEFKKLLADKRIYWPKEGDGRPRVKSWDTNGLVPETLWMASEVGDTEASKKELMEIFSDREALDFHAPKPPALVQRAIGISTKADSVVLDSFAGTGTTAHAVMLANKKDGGRRKFILVEMEDYADSLTAERVRRVSKGYSFKGKKTEELFRESLTYRRLENSDKLLDHIHSIENLEGHRFDSIEKKVAAGVLIVSGEKLVTEKVDGLNGTFTFATLGPEMTLDKLLAGGLPTFEALAKYVFFTATGRTLSELPKAKAAAAGFIGETDLYRVHLFYKPEKKWLQSNDAALAEKLVDEMLATNTDKKKLLVFAAAKFMSQRELSQRGVDFCQLPYAIHRILGD